MSGFTPAPWHLGGEVSSCLGVFSNGRCVARCDWTVADNQDEANARLIAAAPDLLEALRMCLLNGNLDEQERGMGERAIAKAVMTPDLISGVEK